MAQHKLLMVLELVMLWAINGFSQLLPSMATLQYTLVILTILYTAIRTYKEVFPKKNKSIQNEPSNS